MAETCKTGTLSHADTNTNRRAAKGVFTTILLSSIALNWLIFNLLNRQMDQECSHQFNLKAASSIDEIENIFRQYEYDLCDVKSFYECSEMVLREEFRDFTKVMLETFPGLQAVCWIPAVPQEQRPYYEAEARRQGINGYEFVLGPSQHFVIPLSECSVYYPVYYAEPLQGNETLLGMNFSSHREWLSLLQKTAAEGKPAVRISSGLFADQKELCVTLIYPVYTRSKDSPDASNTAKVCTGFVAAVIFPQKDLNSLICRLGDQIIISLSHFQKDIGNNYLLAGRQVQKGATETLRKEFVFGNQRLLIEAAPMRHYFPAVFRLLPWMLLMTGISLGAMLALYVHRIQKENQHAEKLVINRTQELMQEQEKSRLLAEQAQKISQAKSEYLAGMSHEIRTPMNAIIGFAEMMCEENLSHVHREYVLTIHENAKTLMTLIGDILDLSKIETECMEINRLEYPLEELLGHVDLLLRPKALCKELDFRINVLPDMPELIWTDPAHMRQCLINLVSNAIRYTDSGHVYVTVSGQWQMDRLWMRVDVEDTGIGIEEERLQTIFEAFAEPGVSVNRALGSTGLGLSITRRLAQLMGGSLTVQSVPMKGSVFTLLVPLEPVSDAAPAIAVNS